jgi:16S rRNA (adenine1518-N6/adenine1519-N6)-dimethyltransferase
VANNPEPEPPQIRQLLQRFDIKPKKSLGQNFLSDPGVLEKIVRISGVGPEDTVLEIGPGLGSLTQYLAQAARRVFAVEIDQRLLPPLQDAMAPYENVQVFQADILKWNIERHLGPGPFRVVANIPYHITSILIRHLLSLPNRPSSLTLTVQREVAERICAATGHLNLLALSVQVYGDAEIGARIKAGAFFPAPKIDSAVVHINADAAPKIPEASLAAFFSLARAGFAQRRKKLRNTLSGGTGLPKADVEARLGAAGIDPGRRAETLSIAEWGRLVEVWDAS